jgi:ribonuclease P protein component
MKTKGFHKRERIVSRKLIEQLFSHTGSHSKAAFPVRAVYRLEPCDGETEAAPVQLLISVSKRHFKRAVKRNRVKRQIREAYRLQKQILTVHVPQDRSVALAFIWMDDNLCDSAQVSASVRLILKKVSEKL